MEETINTFRNLVRWLTGLDGVATINDFDTIFTVMMDEGLIPEEMYRRLASIGIERIKAIRDEIKR